MYLIRCYEESCQCLIDLLKHLRAGEKFRLNDFGMILHELYKIEIRAQFSSVKQYI